MSTTPGELRRVGARRVHTVRGEGRGPSVVFESALACPVPYWAWVLAHLADDLDCLAYDRPGNGWSPPGRARSAAEHVDELIQLLDEVALPPPYVLVGHSVGGLLVRSVAHRRPDLVAGLVLVDSSHPDQLRRSAAQRRGTPWLRQQLVVARLRAAVGRLHVDLPELADLPATERAATRDALRRSVAWRTALREFDMWQADWAADSARCDDLGARPVAVVTAGDRQRVDPVHGELQRELTGLSSVSRQFVVAGATHEAVVTAPAHATVVAEAVRWVLRGGRG